MYVYPCVGDSDVQAMSAPPPPPLAPPSLQPPAPLFPAPPFPAHCMCGVGPIPGGRLVARGTAAVCRCNSTAALAGVGGGEVLGGYSRVLRGTARVLACTAAAARPRGRGWRCGRAQVRTCPVTDTSARRGRCGSRPRRRAAPRPPPRARPSGVRDWVIS
jgi:hypothetical protein